MNQSCDKHVIRLFYEGNEIILKLQQTIKARQILNIRFSLEQVEYTISPLTRENVCKSIFIMYNDVEEETWLEKLFIMELS